MSKYDNYYKNAYSELSYDDEQQLKLAIMPDEKLLWKGKPKKSAHVLNCIFSKMFPFAMLWLCFDAFFIVTMAASGDIGEMVGFIVPFFAIHLMPVWIWLFGVIKSVAGAGYNTYALTDKRILIKSDNVMFNSVYFEDVVNVAVKRSFADKISGVGDIYIEVVNVGRESILDIAEYREVYDIIQKKVYELKQSGHVPGMGTGRAPFGDFGNGAGGGMYNGNMQGANSRNSSMQNSGYYNNGQGSSDTVRTQYVVNGQFVNQDNNYYDDYNGKQV